MRICCFQTQLLLCNCSTPLQEIQMTTPSAGKPSHIFLVLLLSFFLPRKIHCESNTKTSPLLCIEELLCLELDLLTAPLVKSVWLQRLKLKLIRWPCAKVLTVSQQDQNSIGDLHVHEWNHANLNSELLVINWRWLHSWPCTQSLDRPTIQNIAVSH